MTRKTIVFTRLPSPDEAFWRAYVSDADHIGGCGKTPEEAAGLMLLYNPQRFGVGEFEWKTPPPEMPHPEVNQYPTGAQEEFTTPSST
jgi:hypothetical protein